MTFRKISHKIKKSFKDFYKENISEILKTERKYPAMAYKEEIKRYDVSYYGGGKNVSGYNYRAIIGLRKEDGTLLGAAYFHDNPNTMPDSDSQSASGYVYCHFLSEHFAKIMDLLRNEKPVYLEYVAGSWKHARITTSLEPVGEGESS